MCQLHTAITTASWFASSDLRIMLEHDLLSSCTLLSYRAQASDGVEVDVLGLCIARASPQDMQHKAVDRNDVKERTKARSLRFCACAAGIRAAAMAHSPTTIMQLFMVVSTSVVALACRSSVMCSFDEQYGCPEATISRHSMSLAAMATAMCLGPRSKVIRAGSMITRIIHLCPRTLQSCTMNVMYTSLQLLLRWCLAAAGIRHTSCVMCAPSREAIAMAGCVRV